MGSGDILEKVQARQQYEILTPSLVMGGRSEKGVEVRMGGDWLWEGRDVLTS